MLVLSRKLNESLVIGDDIIITIVGLNADGKIRIGVEAPREVSVHRREVYDAIKRSQAAESCTICGSQKDLRLISTIASTNADGRKWCFACFRIWYDEGVTDSDEILQIRKTQDADTFVKSLEKAMVDAGAIEVVVPTAVCEHVWGIDGTHSNEFCKKCFVDKPRDQ
jgi:carbon storage regulator